MLQRRRRALTVLGAGTLCAFVVSLAVGHLGAGGSQAPTTDAPPPVATQTTAWDGSTRADPDPSAGESTTPPGSPEGTTSAAAHGPPAPGDTPEPQLPATLPDSGTGTTQVLAVPGPDSTRSGRTIRYSVEAEGGLDVPVDHFAAHVHRVLTDPRGWEAVDGVHFVNVSPQQRAQGASADVRIILGSPAYVDRNCLPLRTMGQLSCHAGGRVLLNLERWAHGAGTYGDDVAGYREYLVNHEVGHALGHSHRSCPGPGRPAPVMVQQTKSLYGCTPWGWPTPPSSR
nr:DUF3152 domain-containing protein [Kineosphaera limosa]